MTCKRVQIRLYQPHASLPILQRPSRPGLTTIYEHIQISRTSRKAAGTDGRKGNDSCGKLGALRATVLFVRLRTFHCNIRREYRNCERFLMGLEERLTNSKRADGSVVLAQTLPLRPGASSYARKNNSCVGFETRLWRCHILPWVKIWLEQSSPSLCRRDVQTRRERRAFWQFERVGRDGV